MEVRHRGLNDDEGMQGFCFCFFFDYVEDCVADVCVWVF